MPGPTDMNFFHRAGVDVTNVAHDKRDDPAKVARRDFEALTAGKDHVVAGSLKTKVQAAVIGMMHKTVKGEFRKGMAAPESSKK